MTDLSNLRTASLYINNQLLSRGLLRDGRAIDFADPSGRESKESKKKKDGDDDEAKAEDKTVDKTADTMSRVISVVNDLILRRDRDAEHRESLSTALRTVRAESLRQANDLSRAIERHAEAQRRADLGEATEASLRAQLAAADATNKKLREEAARMRQQVAQTRASCANEVRKRDRQIDGLKKAVADAGRARGERRSPAITTITISGGDSTSTQAQTPRSAISSVRPTPNANAAADATTTSEYNLRSETNAFLADLARGLSSDNEMLLDLVRHTSRRLQTMSGYVPEDDTPEMTTTGMVDCAALAAEMEAVLEHLRTILTNPSFVPIEEVVQRESEIGRLRDGWEKMEGRWKEAVHLLDGWRKRMAVSGRPVNMEEIKMGLRLSPVRVRNVAETSLGLDLRLPPLQEGLDAVHEEEEEDDDAGERNDYDDSEDDEDDAQNWPPLGRTPSPAETLHLVPAPAPGTLDYAPGHEGISDSESDASSIFADDVDDDECDFEDDGPNVQIIEQSIMVPSLEEASPAVFSRSTPSPSPPPPEKPVLSKVATAAIKEQEKADVKAKEVKEAKEAEKPKAAETKVGQQGLRPSHTAGNRQGTKPTSSSDIKKETKTAAAPAMTTMTTTAAVTRGRRRPGEVEETAKDRRQLRIAAATAAAQADKPTAKPAAPRVVASTTTTTTGLTRANSGRVAGGRPMPTRPSQAGSKPVTATAHPVSALSQENKRPTSAASQVSDASSAAASDDSVALVPTATATTTSSRPVSSLAARKLATATSASSTAPTTARSRLDRVQNRSAGDGKTTSVASSSSSSEQMPPPPAPASTAAAANRARSRSPIKMASAGSGTSTGSGTAAASGGSSGTGVAGSGVTSRLPLPTSANVPPPASPALNMATIAAKLAASEREADAARVRAKLKAARSGLAGAKAKAVPVVEAAPPAAETEASVDPVKKTVPETDADPLSTSVNSNGEPAQQPLRKKRDPNAKDQRRASKAASRRRSTLNPWELKSLMTGSVEGAVPVPGTEGAAAVEASS